MLHIAVAVVIPTLDEEEALRANLPTAMTAADEVVVSDGGSRDNTVAVARQMGARTVTGIAGRGPQLNRGADAAPGVDAFLFLHADTRLPEGALASVRRALLEGNVGGGFRVRFDSDRAIFRLGERLVDLRTRLTRAPLGDQAQFATRRSFEELEGFRNWPILEDIDFIRRLRRCGRIVVLPERVSTSARRYLQCGITRTIMTNWMIWILFSVGVSPQRLARLYRHVR